MRLFTLRVRLFTMGEAIYPKVRLFTMRVRLFHGQSHFLSSWSELIKK